MCVCVRACACVRVLRVRSMVGGGGAGGGVRVFCVLGRWWGEGRR